MARKRNRRRTRPRQVGAGRGLSASHGGGAAADAAFEQARALYRAGELEASARACDGLLAEHPRRVDALLLAASIAMRCGRPGDALRPLERAAELEPRAPEIWNNLGTALLHEGRHDDAIEAYRRALRLRSGYVAAHRNLASAYQANDQLDPAIAELEKVLSLAGDEPDALSELAGACALAGRWGEARDAYRKLLALVPGDAAAGEGLAVALARCGEARDAIDAAAALARRVPDRARALYHVAVALLEAGEQTAAAAALRQALACRPSDFLARATLGQLYSDAVPAWHYPMLNDAARNAAFDAAIRKAVEPGNVVLDIGTGTGILAMMAARAGAEHVYACERAGVIAERAREIVAANGFADRITVIGKRSQELVLGADLPRRADVLLCEIVDVILLGEGIIPTLEHALRELVVAGAPVIPSGGAVYTLPVESEALHRLARVGEVSGFDLRAFNELSRYGYLTTRVDGFEFRALCAPEEVFRFDFTRPGFQPQTRRIAATVMDDGMFHGTVSWIELVLADGIRVESKPGGQASHWMQAVHLVDEPRPVRAGDTLEIAAHCDPDHVYLHIQDGRHG